jgi:hydroxylaminobenzene mutase
MRTNDQTAQILIGLGALLFFLGLLGGFAIPAMTNPNMGLSGHLEGVMNGTFLLVIGVAWSRLHLSDRSASIAFWALVYGTFANWIFITLAAIFGTSAMTPIAGAGHSGTPWQESLITAGLFSVGAAMLVGCGLLTWGFYQKYTLGSRE